MVCKNCKRAIDDDSIFCKWCGERQIRERKKKGEVKVPKPRQLADGRWFAQVMIDGERHNALRLYHIQKQVGVGGFPALASEFF